MPKDGSFSSDAYSHEKEPDATQVNLHTQKSIGFSLFSPNSLHSKLQVRIILIRIANRIVWKQSVHLHASKSIGFFPYRVNDRLETSQGALTCSKKFLLPSAYLAVLFTELSQMLD